MTIFECLAQMFRPAGDEKLAVGLHNQEKRERWLENILMQFPAGIRILDAGAGELQYKQFCSHLEYVSQDFGKYDGKGNQTGLQMGAWNNTQLDIVSDITVIPEPDQSFDAIMCIEVFEHIPDPVGALKEFARLLKKGGALILTAPFASLTHFAPYHFVSGFNAYFYQAHLAEHGFEIELLEANGNFFEYLAQEVRRIPKIAQQYAGGEVSRQEEKAINSILLMLQRFSAQDTASDELLCFGYHVKAVKK